MPEVTLGGLPAYVTRMGHGDRKALLIHCSLAHSGAWKGVAAALDDRLDMLAYDLPGHGRSADLPEGADMQELSTEMAADLIGEDGPMDIIGHSFGATVALRLAIERPDLVRSLVMIESVFIAAALADDPALAGRHAHLMAGYDAAVARGDKWAAAREFMTEWGDGRPWEALPEAQQAFLADRIHLIECNNASVLRDDPGILPGKRIEKVTAPALMIRGAESSAFVKPTHAAIVRRLQNGRDIAIPGAGHMVPITHPDAVAREIRAFLATVEAEAV